MSRILVALALVWSLMAPTMAPGHALDPGYLELSALGDDRWRVTWRVPDVGGRAMPLEARLPATCSADAPPPLAFDGRAWTTGWIATCPGGLQGGRIEISGLERTNTDTLVRYELEPGQSQVRRLTASETGFAIPEAAGKLQIIGSYTGLGMTHILEGVDHLLFVFALLLLIRSGRALFWAVTAFTVAHSITLGLASFEVLRVPGPPVEAVIALSIVFLAYELSLPEGRRDPLTTRLPWLVSFGFGLIHGLGFAGALREIGLPQGDIPLALFAFNLGVELGQILFILVMLAIGYAVRWVYPTVRAQAARLTRVASYGIGSLAAFWVIDRISAF
ncbi:HupE/UreJ family protein [Sulfitobacter sp. D35]|uniref:HupE/UreJ family protein n=1 Tax=Sulfitobacter sp. D35 TaxID=3083252 RepID=UPI00296EBB1C|nr:HupE/UreJ family protein [Sulfitobacter sp. D35]MDW4500330.1 HupE/UreJ family protein [Sulfitobacter sp. D35]